MPATTQRRNRAFRIAYLADIKRVIYTVTLSGFVHRWAVIIISKLIPSAYTVLLFLAALHRCGHYGYIGCAIAYDLLAPQIVQATGRKCKTRTLQRGLSFLKKLGLVELRPWTMPDQKIRCGDHLVTVRGTARVELTGGQWCTRQLRIIVLTDRALALWDKATGSQGDRYIAQYPPPANLAANSHNDQCVNTHMIESRSSDDVISDCPQKSVSNFEPSKELSSRGSPSNGKQGKSTQRVSSPMSSSPTFEHQASTPKKQDKNIESSRAPTKASSEPHNSGKTPSKPPSTGCSRERPKIPRKAGLKQTWTQSRLYILSEIHKVLERFSTRQADAIYDRAKFELSRNYPAGWQTTCDWPYWIGRFPLFSQTQRRYHTMRDLLPLLKHPAAITPHEPRRYREGRLQEDAGGKVPQTASIPEFLQKLAAKFCDDD